MIDFNWTEPTLLTTIISFVSYCFFTKKYYSGTICPDSSTSLNKSMFIIALFLVVFVCIEGDWFHYQQMVWNYDFTTGARNYGEKIYAPIIKMVERNYMLFRLFVWGSALCLFLITAKRLSADINAALFFLVVVFLLKFNYARATLGMACYFCGLSFIVSPSRNKLISFTFGIFLMWLATQFHSSCLILLPLTIAVFLPINKFTVALVLIALPLGGFMLRDYLNDFMLSDLMESNEYILGKTNGYMTREDSKANLGGIIQMIITYVPFYLSLLLDCAVIMKNDTVPKMYKSFMKITVCITLFSLSFLFMGLENNVFFYRFLFMTFIPLTLITTALYKSGYMELKRFNMILTFGAASPIYTMLLVLYKTL